MDEQQELIGESELEKFSQIKKSAREDLESDFSAFELFLQGAIATGGTHSVYVYKLSDRKGGVKSYCEKMQGDEPDLDDLREKYGAGKYNFVVAAQGCKPKNYNIDICARQNNLPAQPNVSANIRDMIDAVRPLLEAFRPAPPPAPSQPQLMGDMMKEVSTVLGQGMREMVSQTMKASSEIMKRARDQILPPQENFSDVDNYDDEEEEEPKSDMIKIIESVKEFLPYFSGGVPESIKKKIVNDPRFVETVQDPEKLLKAKKIIMDLAPDSGAAIISSLGLDK